MVELVWDLLMVTSQKGGARGRNMNERVNHAQVSRIIHCILCNSWLRHHVVSNQIGLFLQSHKGRGLVTKATRVRVLIGSQEGQDVGTLG